ncbi:MAG: transporter substrate-binding domain-containing protein [Spirochaetales bacterium]|nr:transporter substrate-binding domain-containing protein [Spirochaetales bacterium]
MNKSVRYLLRLTVCVLMLVSICGCIKSDRISSIRDLSGKRIGVQSGTTSEELLMNHDAIHDTHITSYQSSYAAVADLMTGTIDAVVVDYLPATKLVSKYRDLTIVADTFPVEEYAIAVKKGNKELLDMINDGIESIRNSGEYAELIEAFMPIDGEVVVPERMRISGTNKLLIGTNAAFPPFEYLDGGDVIGFDMCIIQMIALRHDMQPIVKDMEFVNLLKALQDGVVDCVIAGMSVTKERAALVDFSKPYFSSHQVIIVKK